MKTKTSENQEKPVLISKTQHLIRKHNRIPPGEFDGPLTHFIVDQNTMEAILQAVWNYTLESDASLFVTRIDLLKQNLYITNPTLKMKH